MAGKGIRLARASPTERLQREFDIWASCGGGGIVWDFPVRLEPPFESFLAAPRLEPLTDDGQSHDLWSKSWEWFRDTITGKRLPLPEPETPQSMEWLASPEPNEYPIEFQILVPPTLNIPKDCIDQLLIGLTYCRRPLAFEIVGLPQSIELQFVADVEDAGLVESKLSSHLPDVVFLRRTHTLKEQWIDAREDGKLILDFGFTREFILPLASVRNFSLDPLAGLIG